MSQEQAKQFIEQATQSLQSGQHQQALELLDQAIEMAPNDSEAYVLRGIALAHSNQGQAATESFRRAITLSPYNAKAYYNLAVHQYAQGNKVEALEMAREAAKIDTRHGGARTLITQIENEMLPQAPAAEKLPGSPMDPLSAPREQGPEQGPQRPSAPPPGTGDPLGPRPPSGPYQPPQPTSPPPAGPYPGGPPLRSGYETPEHSLAFVKNMGGAWTAIGWFLAVANLMVLAGSLIVMWPVIQEAMANPQAAEQMQSSPGMMMINVLWLVSLVGIVGWTIFDLIDRRGNFLWLLPNILCSCCLFGWIALPIYLLAGRN
jgi:tetratricopeptide (TPR) repeat protein